MYCVSCLFAKSMRDLKYIMLCLQRWLIFRHFQALFFSLLYLFYSTELYFPLLMRCSYELPYFWLLNWQASWKDLEVSLLYRLYLGTASLQNAEQVHVRACESCCMKPIHVIQGHTTCHGSKPECQTYVLEGHGDHRLFVISIPAAAIWSLGNMGT